MDKYSTTGTTDCEGTKWSVPEIIESANRLAQDRNGCILMIDDLHRVNMSVAPYLYGLLGERKLGSFILDKRVAIMGAMNDSEEAGFTGLDSPIKDRIGMLEVKFDFDYWFKHWGSQLHFYISSFLKTHSQYVLEDETTMIEQSGSPRSWTHLGNEFELYDLSFLQEHTVFLSKQKVSAHAAQALSKHIAYIEAINFIDKVKNRIFEDIDSMKPLDTILYAYIINYISSMDDAKYMMKVIDNNINCSNFIGFIVGELFNKFKAKEQGKHVSKGVQAILYKLLEQEPTSDDKKSWSATDRETFDSMKFKEHTKLFELASEFL